MLTVPTKIGPAVWNVLLQAIHDGKCIPFLGAGANIGGEGPPIPTGTQLAMSLVSEMTGVQATREEELVELKFVHEGVELNRDIARLRLTDLARVSLHYRNEVGPAAFIASIKERIVNPDCRPSPLLKLIAELPVELIVTTNYDYMMEAALGQRAHKVVVQPLEGYREKTGREINELLMNFEGVRLYKLHGGFPAADDEALPGNGEAGDRGAAGDASPIIITEEDYIQFLTIFREPLKGVPEWIKARFATGQLLFLGYGLEDWDFRTLYEGVLASVPRYQKLRSIAIQKDPSETWVEYWKAREVKIYSMDLQEFTGTLREKYDSFRRNQPPPGLPPAEVANGG